ncbi:hypothetical protein R5R35_009121 [Gryllus longicercus]|uniref:ENTH domain-containing protein n=1 Tax=Gryllus longicercus TaxID=2509291 RepID=A0AAN9VZF7_9ORTH
MEATRKNTVSDIMDKVSFVNYLPMLTRATADNQEPVPGYLFQEIEKITLQPEPSCQLLVDYLTQRLDRPSAAVKMKVLKIMKHLVNNAPRHFRYHLRKKDGSIKMATSYHEAPNPLTGTSAAEAVRKHSQDLLQLLFDAQLMAADENPQSKQVASSNIPKLGGLGSSKAASGKYEGFGSSPMQKEMSITDKILHTIESWATTPDETNRIIQEALSNDPGNYEPIPVNLVLPSPSLKPPTQPQKPPVKKRVHIPGKAGGGWEELPVPYSSSFLGGDSVVSADSSSDPGAREATENTVSEADDINTLPPEASLVQDFCSSGPLPCSLSEIRSTGQRCVQLNVKEVVQSIVKVLETHFPQSSREESQEELETGNPEVQLTRAMLLLEWLLRTDVVHYPTVSDMCCSSLTQIASLNKSSASSKPLPLQAKAEKLLLILEKLKALPI